MADDPSLDPVPAEDVAPAATSTPAVASTERAGDFERYALLAAITLVVLCLLLWDRWHDVSPTVTSPPADRTLRVEIGGDAPKSAPGGAPAKKSVSQDPPGKQPAPPPAPPAPAPQRTYTVKQGDNLNDIARRELGSAARADEIAKLNGITDPSKLKINQVLKLPPK
jgi:nucleoid-associated protein YgaU